MRILRDFTVALSFTAALLGAGLASGKEVVLFLGDASPISVALCAATVGACSLPFILAAIYSDGDAMGFIFRTHREAGNIIIRIINFLFLSAMLGGAEVLFEEFLSIKGGSVIMSVLTLAVYHFGNKFIKVTCSVLTTLGIASMLYLFLRHNGSFSGKLTILSPILYAGMNTMCAGLFASNMCKDLKPKDAGFISIAIAIMIGAVLFLIRSSVVGAEFAEIPLYYVAKDTNLAYLGAFIIMSSIFTSTISGLNLSVNKNKELSPLITILLALFVSTMGFSKIVNYCYPLIGFIGLLVLGIATIRLISMKLKVKKSGAYL